MSITNTPAVTREFSSGRNTADKSHGDTNACTVNALFNTTGFEYNLCHDIAAASGRKKGRGHDPVALLKLAGRYGIQSRRLTRIKRSNTWTVQKFVKKNPTGNFYVCSSTHAFAIVDGIVKDWLHNGDLVRIVQAWRIVKAVYNGRKPKVPVHVPKPRPASRGPRVEYTIRLKGKDGSAYDVHYYVSRADAIRDAKSWELTDAEEGPYAVEVERVTIGHLDWTTVYERSFSEQEVAA